MNSTELVKGAAPQAARRKRPRPARGEAGERRPPLDEAVVRRFGLVVLVGLGLVGAFLRWRGHPMAASTAWVLGAGISTLALVAPGPARPVYGAWMAAARFLGRINMTILLTLVYVFMFCGLGLLLRLLGRDALHLEIERQAETYWEPKRPSEPRRYLNQF